MGRTPTSSQTDFAVRHRIRFGNDNRFTIVAEADILNLFNSATATNFGTFITDTEYDVVSLLPVTQQLDCIINNNYQPCLIAGYTIFQDSGAPGFLTDAENAANRYPTYNKASAFQGPRQVRFGIRFLF